MQREPPLGPQNPRWSETSDVIPMFATLVWKIELEARVREAIGVQGRSDRALETGRYHLWACGDTIRASLLGSKSIAPGRPSCHSIIGDEAPNFSAQTTEGPIDFHAWLGDSWAILFSHPKDFTPVCTTELGYMAGLKPEFAKRNCKIIGLSVDSVADHERWAKDIRDTQGPPNYPLIGDVDLRVAKLYDMLHPNASGTAKDRSPADNATVRSVFLIGPDKKIKATLTYPMSTGRNFDEVLRLLDSIQLTAKFTVATPVNWKPGGRGDHSTVGVG